MANITNSTQTIVLQPGESFVLPTGSEIIYSSDPENLESGCAEIPITQYKCGYFFIVLDADSNTYHSMDMNTKYVSLKIGSTTYNIDEFVLTGDSNSPTPTDEVTLNTHITNTGLFEFMNVTENEVTSRTHIHVYFKVLETYYNDLFLVINNNNVNSTSYYPPNEAVCGVYPDPD